MKKRNLNKMVLSKAIVGRLYGGINDDDEDDNTPPRRKSDNGNCANDHTRGCPSWNIAC